MNVAPRVGAWIETYRPVISEMAKGRAPRGKNEGQAPIVWDRKCVPYEIIKMTSLLVCAYRVRRFFMGGDFKCGSRALNFCSINSSKYSCKVTVECSIKEFFSP